MAYELGSAYGRINIDSSGAVAGVGAARGALGTLTGGMASARKAMMDTGKTMTMGVTMPILGVAVAIAKTAGSFEAQMNTLSIAAGKSGTSLQDLQKAAIAVGSDTDLVGISASEAAEAMENFYKAGLETNDIFSDMQGYLAGTTDLTGALRAAIDLAAASELDLGAASEATVVAMSSFNMSADQAGEIADSFVQSADASVTSVSELTAAMVNVGPVASSFGLSLGETNALLAILSERGIRGSEAGTALRSMFNNMIRPVDAVKESYQMLGVELYDAQGNMREFPDILDDLREGLYGTVTATTMVGGRTEAQNNQLKLAESSYKTATDAIYKHGAGLKVLSEDQLAKYQSQQAAANTVIQELSAIQGEAVTTTRQLTEAERNEAIQTIAGTYGKSALITLMDDGNDAYGEMTKKVQDAATAQEVSAARTQGLNAAIEQFQGTLEALVLTVGPTLLQGFLTPLLTKITEILGMLQGSLNPEMIKWILIIAGVAAAAGPLMVLLGMLLSPMGLLAAAAVALGYAWTTNFGGIRDAVMAMWAAIQPTLIVWVAWIRDMIPVALAYLRGVVLAVMGAISAWWTANGETIIASLKSWWQWLSITIPQAFTFVLGVIMAWWSWIVTNVPAAFAVFQTGAARIGEFFAPMIENLKAAFAGVLEAFQPLMPILERFGLQVQAALPGLQTLAGLIGGLLLVAIRAFGEALAFILPIFAQIGTFVLGTVIEAIGGVIQFVSGAVEMFVGLFTNDLDRARAGASAVILGLVNVIVSPILTLGEQLGISWPRLWAWMVQALNVFVTNVQAVFKVFTTKTLEPFVTLAMNLYKGWNDLWNGLLYVLQTASSHVKLSAEDMLDSIYNLIMGWGEQITNLFRTAWEKVVSLFRTARTRLYNILNAWITSAKLLFSVDSWVGMGKSIIEGLVKGVTDAKDAFGDVIKGLATDALDKMKAALGIGSASKVFGEQVGKNIPLGVAEGIRAFGHIPTQAILALSNTLRREAISLAEGVGGHQVVTSTTMDSRQQTFGGDTYSIYNQDGAAVNAMGALIEERRAARLNKFMGA